MAVRAFGLALTDVRWPIIEEEGHDLNGSMSAVPNTGSQKYFGELGRKQAKAEFGFVA